VNPFIRPWRHLFDFNGRASRTEYGLFHVGVVLLYFAVSLVFALIALLVAVLTGSVEHVGSGIYFVISIVEIVVFFLIFLIGHLSVTIRRLHDHNEPGLKYLLTFIPFVGIIFWALLVFTRGTEGENDYGHDPRQPEPVSTEKLESVFS